MSDVPQGDHSRHFDDLADQGVDTRTMGLAYGRRTLPGLDGMAPADAYVHGFMDGVRAALAQWELVQARDWGELLARMYDADVMPGVDE